MLPYLIAGAIGYGIAKLFEDDTPKYADGGLIAPNGKKSNLTPEQYKLVRTPAFKKWFGDWENSPETSSKVVDSNGEPLVVLHGTNSKFNVFDVNKFNKNEKSGDYIGEGFYFTNEKNKAKQYGLYAKSFFLKSKSPLLINEYNYFKKIVEDMFGFENVGTIKVPNYYQIKKQNPSKIKNKFIELGYDGLIDNLYNQYAVFEPEQIKLADGTNTSFDGNNPDIRFNGGGNISKEFVIQELDEDYKEVYQVLGYKNIGGDDFFFSRLNIYPEQNVFTIELPSGKEIGRATLNEKENYLINIRIDENYRRKGLGTNLYDFIEYVTGKKLKPSPDKISKEAKELWMKRNPDIRFNGGGVLPDNIFDYLKEKGFEPLGNGLRSKSNCTIKMDFSNVLYQAQNDNRVRISPIEYSDYKKAFTILEFHCRDKNKGIGTAVLEEIIRGADLFGYTIFIEPTSMKKYRVETDINTDDLKRWYSKFDFKPINNNYSNYVWLRSPKNPDIS